MTGPAPKPKEQRRNKAEPRRGEWIDLPEEGKFKLVLPRLPDKMPDGQAWPAQTKRAYKAWRDDPASSQLSVADADYVLETAIIHAYWVSEPYKYEKALVARLDKLGFTPKGKRDLRYRLPVYVDAIEQGKKTNERNKRNTDRRARLSLVEGDG